MSTPASNLTTVALATVVFRGLGVYLLYQTLLIASTWLLNISQLFRLTDGEQQSRGYLAIAVLVLMVATSLGLIGFGRRLAEFLFKRDPVATGEPATATELLTVTLRGLGFFLAISQLGGLAYFARELGRRMIDDLDLIVGVQWLTVSNLVTQFIAGAALIWFGGTVARFLARHAR